MPKQANRVSAAEKSQIVAEVQRRYCQESKTYQAIFSELGISGSSYYAWIKSKGSLQSPVIGKNEAASPRKPSDRAQLVAEIDRLRKNGQTLKSACKTIRISAKSYRRWKSAIFAPVLRPVAIKTLVPVAPAEIPAKRDLLLSAPGGYQIVGLDIAGAAALLRALA